ncbi:2-hydroxyacid dehydrogenase-like protein 2 [Elsinoe fawcettii]|nr:2-hydroxyacid dehydrogenase-like protein 2 [Elsinoe fawcettii]
MAKPKVLLLGDIVLAEKAQSDVASIAELITPKATSREEFISECKSGAFDGAVAAYRTFGSFSFTGLIDSELLEVLPKSLKFLAHNGAGYDQIDVNACSSRSPPVLVSNVPTAVDDSTADTAVFLIIGALRNFNTSLIAARKGDWRGNPPPPLGHDPQGKVLGILGMGGIGRNLKAKMDLFGMTTIYHNRRKLEGDLAGGAEYVSFDELLAKSDVLSLNLPLNKNTHHIISTEEFKKMKKGVTIINTARGAVMDEDALVKALDSGHVYSVGLDVFEDEPKIHPGLIANPNVLLLPHMGTWSVETQLKMEEWCLSNVKSAVETGKLRSPVLNDFSIATNALYGHYHRLPKAERIKNVLEVRSDIAIARDALIKSFGIKYGFLTALRHHKGKNNHDARNDSESLPFGTTDWPFRACASILHVLSEATKFDQSDAIELAKWMDGFRQADMLFKENRGSKEEIRERKKKDTAQELRIKDLEDEMQALKGQSEERERKRVKRDLQGGSSVDSSLFVP